METWEQTWTLLPLDSSRGGGFILRGKGRKARLSTASTVTTAATTDSSNVVRTASERHSSESESKTEVRKPPDVMAILVIWTTGVLLLTGMGYLLVKHQNKQSK